MASSVNVYGVDGESVVNTVERPDVFDVDIREDLVRRVHNLVKQNSRVPYGVSPLAGMQHSAESWGTGRAVARCPRVKGSGTRRAGQAAFANFARKGRMAHPTKVTRRWTRKTPLTLRRTVSAMAIAATAYPEIVEGRGHRISSVNSLPLVVSDEIASLSKTKDAMALLKKLGLTEDLERVENSRTITCGKGKMRNRRYNMKRGVLIIHDGNDLRAFNNIRGLDSMDVNSLDLLGLAPGGKVGRLVLWTQSAFLKLNSLYGSMGGYSEVKTGYYLPSNMITADDLESYFYSSEVQALINTPNLLGKSTCVRSEEDLALIEKFARLYDTVVN